MKKKITKIKYAKKETTRKDSNRAVFLDRDGTLNYDHGYTHRIEDLEILAGVVEGLKILQKLGFRFFIVSNQSGIGRGYYTEGDFWKFTHHLNAELQREGVHIEKSYFSPHHPDEPSEMRKPATGMLRAASQEFGIELSRSYMIGDMTKDVKTGKDAGCTTVLLKTGYKKGKDKEHAVEPDFVANDFLEAAKWIAKNEGQPKSPVSKRDEKVYTREKLAGILEQRKGDGKIVVTINGSFDILHAGHIYILEQAKAQGDILVVMLNSDVSIKRYKSKDRPFINQDDRATMLCALWMVDYVCLFDETTPNRSLEILRPNVHVNGAEYGKDCVEAPVLKKFGARLQLVERIGKGTLSTTELIKKIRASQKK